MVIKEVEYYQFILSINFESVVKLATKSHMSYDSIYVKCPQ